MILQKFSTKASYCLRNDLYNFTDFTIMRTKFLNELKSGVYKIDC
jgi:hypothetical protein